VDGAPSMSRDKESASSLGETGLPQISEAIEIRNASKRAFTCQIPNDWNENQSSENDYGWDYNLTIPSEPGRVGPEFYVQLKGSRSVEYLADGQHAALGLKVSTVKWLLGKSIPTALALCDVAVVGTPVYWVWVHEAIRPVEKTTPNWRGQDTVTLRIPLANRLAESHARIAADVVGWYRELAVDRAVGDVIAPLVPPLATPSPLPPATLVQQTLVPVLIDVGLAETSETGSLEPLGAEERETREALRRAGRLLTDYYDTPARHELESIRSRTTSATVGTRAQLANCEGILRLHDGDRVGALAMFRQAAALKSDEPKYRSNILAVEHVIAHETGAPVPSDWDSRLNALLASHPGFTPAVFTRVRRLAETSLDDAESALRSSPAFQKDRAGSLSVLAELYADRHPDKALALITELESTGTRLPAFPLGLKGGLLLAKALGQTPPVLNIAVRGPGPSLVDFGLLRKADAAYQTAIADLRGRGFPRVCEYIVYNAATTSLLLAEPKAAVRYCREFLEAQGDSAEVSEILSLALVHVGERKEACVHALRAYDLNPTSRRFTNLLLALLNGNEDETIIERVAQRRARGSLSEREVEQAAQALAIAHTHLGDDSAAEKELAVLRQASADLAVATEVMMRRIRGESGESVAAALRAALVEGEPTNVLLTELLQQLLPVTQATCVEIISIATQLATLRQLCQEEVLALGRALHLAGQREKAEATFRAARDKFRSDARFAYEHAHALADLGHEEEAIEALHEYVRIAGHSYESYRNLGMLARLTGRIDTAIQLFQAALRRGTDLADKTLLRGHLFQLRMTRGDPPIDCWRELDAFGKTVTPNTEDEARYLMMGFFVRLGEQELRGDEIAASVAEYQQRLSAFLDAHPKFDWIRRIEIPAGLSDWEAREFLLGEVAYLTLLGRMRAAQREMAARGLPMPLCMRKGFLGSTSIFDYWERCIASSEPAHAIHIHIGDEPLDAAATAVDWTTAVCVDVTALLTLQHLALLDEILGVLPQIVLPESFRALLAFESSGFKPTHALVARLQSWMAQHRSKIRVRRTQRTHNADDTDGPYSLRSGVWMPAERRLGEALTDGVGEAIELARELGIPLYSDEAVVRHWAGLLGVKSFGTTGLLRKLRQNGRIASNVETRLLAQLVASNHRSITYEVQDIHSRLTALVKTQQEPPRIEQLQQDAVLGVFLGDLRTPGVSADRLLSFAFKWMLTSFVDDTPDATRVALISHLTFLVTQRFGGGVILGVSARTPDQITAILGARLLLSWQSIDPARVGRVWSVFRSVVEQIYHHSEEKAAEVLFQLMPDAALQVAKTDGDQSVTAGLSCYLPESDRKEWEKRLTEKLFPSRRRRL
jgi:tetratricopeptide (TPR) repeat protein